MPGPTRTVSTVSTVRTLRYGGNTLQYGLYGTKYLLATMPTTVPTTMPTTMPTTTVLGTSKYELYGSQALRVLTHIALPSSPQSACVAAQGHHRPRGSFSAVCAAQRQQKPWDFALPAARRHRRAIPQRRGVPSSCGDPAAAAARARQCKTSPSRLPRLSRTPRTRLGCWQPSSRQRPRTASPASTRRTPGSTHRQI
jgi:hypothetical protein